MTTTTVALIKTTTVALINSMIILHWSATCDLQQCGILTSVDSDEPVKLLIILETPKAVRSVA